MLPPPGSTVTDHRETALLEEEPDARRRDSARQGSGVGSGEWRPSST
ncbi:MAG: hypothetical protein MZU91_08070 [Desulfosudis oleivorans]|nr:hypothetical protein [Desulfosudis oleivorans]